MVNEKMTLTDQLRRKGFYVPPRSGQRYRFRLAEGQKYHCLDYWAWDLHWERYKEHFGTPYPRPDWIKKAMDIGVGVGGIVVDKTILAAFGTHINIYNGGHDEVMVAEAWDYLVLECDGTIRPCDPAKFDELYEFVEKGEDEC